MNENEIRKCMIDAREEYIEMVKSEMLGPGSEFSFPDAEHELISSSPISRYSVGILFPQGNLMYQDNDETVPTNENAEESSKITEIEPSDEGGGLDETLEKSKDRFYLHDETADENLDEEISMSTQYMPSSMGITFLVSGDCSIVRGNLSFATYRKALISDCVIPYTPDNPENYVVPNELANIIVYDKSFQSLRLLNSIKPKDIKAIFENDTIPDNEYEILRKILYRFADYCATGYVRVPHEIREFVLDFSGGDYLNGEVNAELDGTSAKIVALRSKIADDIWAVTIMVVNDLVEEAPAKPFHCLFQPRLEISTDVNSFCFAEYSPNAYANLMDDEERSLELLYRHKKIYGTGLGTSVDWNINQVGRGSIWNDFFPVKEIPPMSFTLPQNELLSDFELSMKYLSDLGDGDKESKLQSLKNLVTLYKLWVDELEFASKALDAKYSSAATNNIAQCKRAYQRMYAGIDTLRTNNNAYHAFLLANRAMFMQRIHIAQQNKLSRKNADRYPEDEEIAEWLNKLDYRKEDDSDCRWRPFQIAFLLMDINSIVEETSQERSLVDLIWFPTGGGKTEAYLGLTAFTIFFRKLSYPGEDAGTAVIMRYTLRLLAAQQFTRAATLICACEYIRQDCMQPNHKYPIYSLGKKPITIGLWIGGTHTPNKNVEGDTSAKYHLDKLWDVSSRYQVRNAKDRHNKFQVLKCPWCGTKMVKDDKDKKLVGDWGYAMRGKHFYMFCPHAACTFTRELPIQIVDEELYRTPPTLLFGTVDKFAMLPWEIGRAHV